MVFLRPIFPEDREQMLDILTSQNLSKTYMLPDYEHREDAVQLFVQLMEMSRDARKYVRAIAAEDGLVGFLNHTDIQGKEIELGYVIHPDFHGKGYMTRALRLAVEELFGMGYHEVTAGAFSTNAASIRVMEKCGMKKIDKTDEIEYRGNIHTCIYYRKYRSNPMLKYPCLILDHDDTAVKSEITVNYPCFLLALEKFRPGETMDYPEFVSWCFRYEFTEFLRIKYGFSDEELLEEYHMWQDYSKTHIPPAYEGIRELIHEQKRRGGLVCVASLSSRENILRDYRVHFGLEPDVIFSCDDPREQRKPNTYPLEQIMKRYNLSPDQLLMVDDLQTGYQMASKAGVPMAFAAWSRQENPEVLASLQSLCDFTFHSPAELMDFLFSE